MSYSKLDCVSGEEPVKEATVYDLAQPKLLIVLQAGYDEAKLNHDGLSGALTESRDKFIAVIRHFSDQELLLVVAS
jgi:hypothetical protein